MELNESAHPAGQSSRWYLDNKDKIFQEYFFFQEHLRPLLARDHGSEKAASLLDSTVREYETLLGDLPYIGGDDNMLTSNLYLSAACLAFYHAVKSPYQAGKYLFDGFYAMCQTMAKMRPQNDQFMSDKLDGYLKASIESKKRVYPGDWVFDFIPPDERNDFGVDYLECGIHKYFHAKGADEFTPYLCLLDCPSSVVAGTGLVRTTTLARGGKCCDFRFKAGRKVSLEWDPGYVGSINP